MVYEFHATFKYIFIYILCKCECACAPSCMNIRVSFLSSPANSSAANANYFHNRIFYASISCSHPHIFFLLQHIVWKFFCLFACVYVFMCMYVYSPAKRYSFGNVFLEFRRINNLRALIQRRSFAFHIKYQFAHMLLRLKYASRYDNQILLSDYQHSYIYSS